MIKRLFLILPLLLTATFLLVGCDTINVDESTNAISIEENTNSKKFSEDTTVNSVEEETMKFEFEAVDRAAYIGGPYLMDFGEMPSAEDVAIIEGKLLTVFGAPAETSEDYENSFNYFIRCTADDGRSVVLNVYNMGFIHIGGTNEDDFEVQASNALIEYVNSAEPTDYQRTVYYLDVGVKMDTTVRNGKATISSSFLSEEEIKKLFDKLYG